MAVDVNNLIITSCDSITGFDNSGAVTFILSEPTEFTISNSQEKTDVTGKGGRTIAFIKRSKAATISAQNGTIVGGAIAAATGSDVVDGSFNIVVSEEVVVDGSNEAVITGTPAGTAGAEIAYAYVLNSNGSLTTKIAQDSAVASGKFTYTSAGKKLKFHTDIVEGTKIVVFYEESKTAAKIENDSEVFSKTCKLVAKIVAQDVCDNAYVGEVIVKRADVDGNFDLSISDSPAVQSLSAECLAGGCQGGTDLWTLYIYED